jgi:hypothetical protein
MSEEEMKQWTSGHQFHDPFADIVAIDIASK